MLSTLWRFLLCVSDWRRAVRKLLGQPALDVVFITNIRDEAERRRFFPAHADRLQHASGPRMHLHGVAAQVRGINFTAEEMYTPEGRRQAKGVFIDAVRWAESQGAKVVLLAASTKRLFGRDGAELKKRFPHMVFTIGDNGTALLLCADVERAITESGLDRQRVRVLILGPYGILGQAVTEHVQRMGYQAVGHGGNRKLLLELSARTGLPIAHDLGDVGPVDLVVACTHSTEAKLDTNAIEQLRRPRQKLLVVDVAEPANLDEPTWRQCAHHVVRQDAGNAHSPQLHYVLGALSHGKLHLPRGTVFGCFAEAMALYDRIFRQHDADALAHDWFEVNTAQTALVGEAFTDLDIGLPTPHCFGHPVAGFYLPIGPHGLARHSGLMPLPASEHTAA
jgi:predicted amino acid dehydrogenase